jgi:phospholipid/cholesterol/gamma-HCH transport system permease protein
MTWSEVQLGVVRSLEQIGRRAARSLDAIGFGAALLGQSVYWLALGHRRRQPVRPAPVAREMMDVGIAAIPIVTVLSGTIGVMLALQGIDALEPFGAQHQVTLGVALSITREFGPLITGIIVAGRSGSALSARLGTMQINNEVDALSVMGIHPVRYLVVPSLVALVVMLPVLAIWADLVGLATAGLYVTADLGMTFPAYVDQVQAAIEAGDVLHGVSKAAIFGGLIALVGVVNGSQVRGGAEGVGRATTSAVVQAITVIVLADLVFVFAATR